MFTLPQLPWAKDALEPTISKETIEYHYGKHHQAYVDKLNKLVPGTEFEDATLEEIVKKSKGDIFNNGAQVWNHTFYWESLTPDAPAKPEGQLMEKIVQEFGSFEEFKKEFADAATSQFGSGWAWLVLNGNGKLSIEKTGNAENPMTKGMKPLLTCDVWEHAYYIDYRNKRPDYVESFFKIINWNKVAERMENNR